MFSVDPDCQRVQNFEKVVENVLVEVVVIRNSVVLNKEEVKAVGFRKALCEKERHDLFQNSQFLIKDFQDLFILEGLLDGIQENIAANRRYCGVGAFEHHFECFCEQIFLKQVIRMGVREQIHYVQKLVEKYAFLNSEI